MEENQVVAVVVIDKTMKKFALLFICFYGILHAQDSTLVFKKKVQESTEIDFISSYYQQDGVHSAVSGGIGSENLQDVASNIIITMPIKADGVLTFDIGVSAYTSASSSNINPFNIDEDEDEDKAGKAIPGSITGTPWQASSGASMQDALASVVAGYAHHSDDRNKIWNANVSFSNEYDYTSIGFGGAYAYLMNQKNTEFNVKFNVFLDQWRPIYPIEFRQFQWNGSQWNPGLFANTTIWDSNGNASANYNPTKFTPWQSSERNSYSVSIGLSQILNKNMQFSIFLDLVRQMGNLSTPYQRIYFADKPDFFIGNPDMISVYTTPQNTGAYQLADDVERLPNTRSKIPIGLRWNYYINEQFILRTYYRYYWDDWGIQAHTAQIEASIKLGEKFSMIPNYRFYQQSSSDYFAPYNQHMSSERFYSSDYDLSKFEAHAYGAGLQYYDLLNSKHIWKFGIKNIDLRYQHYSRSDGLAADIISFGVKFIWDK